MLKATVLLVYLVIFLKVRGESIVSIASGTGFTICEGYCYNTIIISSSVIQTIETSTTDEIMYPEIDQEYTGNSSTFNQLVELAGDIDIWKTIDTTIGCPYCNEGFEWLALITDVPPKHSVTFEYNQTIPGFEQLLNSVRAIREQYLSTSNLPT